ncbi:MAG: hypothetical protein A2033_00285 [Bacteroidetes bacterium GWA2_31_9]|nr:MAG: hypothetical protein A2033_00285 [Bacteroidetes bacterium GWA2_31_9]
MKLLGIGLAFIVFFLASCRKENCFDCFKGVGKQTTEQRNLNNFQIISIYDPFQVYLIQDTLNKIELEGGENLLGLISSDINNNELIIKNNNKCNWSRSYKKSIITLNIHFNKLDSLYIVGECDVFSKDTINFNHMRLNFESTGSLNIKLKGNNLDFWQIGNGDFTLEGNVSSYFIGSLGSGNIFSKNLHSHFTYVTARHTANCYIYSDKILEIIELGYGNVYYSGNPDSIYIKTIVGNGKIIEQ